jgi:hypothetical protein
MHHVVSTLKSVLKNRFSQLEIIDKRLINTGWGACFLFGLRVNTAVLLRMHCFGLPKFQLEAVLYNFEHCIAFGSRD